MGKKVTAQRVSFFRDTTHRHATQLFSITPSGEISNGATQNRQLPWPPTIL